MSNNSEAPEPATHLAYRSLSNGELIFSFPNVLAAIDLYTQREIAVLGIEVLTEFEEGYRTEKLSGYSSEHESGSWGDFVASRNVLATEFVKDQVRADNLFLLTTATHLEYANLRVP